MFKRIAIFAVLAASIAFTGCESPSSSSGGSGGGGHGIEIIPKDSIDIYISRNGAGVTSIYKTEGGTEVGSLDAVWNYKPHRTVRIPFVSTILATVYDGKYKRTSRLHIVEDGYYELKAPMGYSQDTVITDLYHLDEDWM